MEKELGRKEKVMLASKNAAALFYELVLFVLAATELKNVLCIFHSVVYRHQRNNLSFHHYLHIKIMQFVVRVRCYFLKTSRV